MCVLHACVPAICMPGALGGQRRAPELQLQVVENYCGCWEQNPGPLEE